MVEANKSLTVRLSQHLMKKLQAATLKRKELDFGFSVNQWVNHAIIEKLEREAAQPRHLASAIIGKRLIVAHPAILPHEICYADGKWYCYPISPELDKLQNVEFVHGSWNID